MSNHATEEAKQFADGVHAAMRDAIQKYTLRTYYLTKPVLIPAIIIGALFWINDYAPWQVREIVLQNEFLLLFIFFVWLAWRLRRRDTRWKAFWFWLVIPFAIASGIACVIQYGGLLAR